MIIAYIYKYILLTEIFINIFLFINIKCNKMNTRKNGFQRPWSFKQIVSCSMYIKFVIFYNILMITKVPNSFFLIGSIIFNLLFGLSFTFFIITSYINPADPLVYKKENSSAQGNNYFMCSICKSSINLYSHHCATCNKCVYQFDHHCK